MAYVYYTCLRHNGNRRGVRDSGHFVSHASSIPSQDHHRDARVFPSLLGREVWPRFYRFHAGVLCILPSPLPIASAYLLIIPLPLSSSM